MMQKLLIPVFLAACVAAGPAPVFVDNPDCLEQDNALFSCIFAKVIGSLDRAARSSDIELINGVTFVRDTPMERTAKSLPEKSESDILNELPSDSFDRATKITSMLYDSTDSFLKSHSLKFSMPKRWTSRDLVEGRGKIKKMVLPLIAAAGLKIFALVPVLLGGLALLALKALFFGKIALLIAGIMAFQKFFSGGSVATGNFFGKNPQINGWYDNGVASGWSGGSAGSQPQGYYRRSIDANANAHNLAYSAHAPAANDTD